MPRIRDQHRVTVKGNHHTAARMGQLSILLALPRTTRTRAHPLPLSCLLLLSPCVVLTRLLCFVWLFWCVFDCLCVFFVLSYCCSPHCSRSSMSTVAAPTGHVAADDRSLATKAVSATMISPYRYLMLFIPPLVTLLGMYMRGLWLLMTPLVMYAVVPILDIVIPADHTNPTAEDRRVLEQARVFRAITYAWAPLQCGLVLLGCTIAPECALWELPGLALAVSVCTGGYVGGARESILIMHAPSPVPLSLRAHALCACGSVQN